MSEYERGKSDTELVVETFVDRMVEVHPDLDRDQFREAIDGVVREHVPGDDEDENENEDED